jgi:hypothetical protein
MHCATCGANTTPGQRFCWDCGATLIPNQSGQTLPQGERELYRLALNALIGKPRRYIVTDKRVIYIWSDDTLHQIALTDITSVGADCNFWHTEWWVAVKRKGGLLDNYVVLYCDNKEQAVNLSTRHGNYGHVK